MATTKIQRFPTYTDNKWNIVVDIEGNTFTLQFRWSERESSWHFDVIDSSDVYVAAGVKVVADYPMLEGYDITSYGLSGYFYCVSESKVDPRTLHTTKEALANNYMFCYIWDV